MKRTGTILAGAAALVFACLLLTGGLGGGAEPPVGKAADPKAAVNAWLDKEAGSLEEVYKELHRQPELSLQEEKTAARLAKELKELGFTVTTGVGGPTCPGIVGVLKNGEGPKVLVRTDLDGLPVVERTGLPYASKVRTRDRSGTEVGTMHACGHDMHMTCWLGTARFLASHRDLWKGTLVFVGQPAEEIGAGARLMLADKFFERFGKPDYALALHCDARMPVGQVGYTEGLALANVDTVEIVVKGKGGHGAAPHTTIDPVVLAARIVLDLQTIVSRETNPLDPVVVTVGSIHGGTKSNIIPNEVKLQLTVRTTKDDVRKHTLEAIERLAKAAAVGARAAEPAFTHFPEEFTPALVNDRELTRRTAGVLRETLGEGNVLERPPVMGGEDFGQFGRAGVPICMFFLGTIDADRVAEANRPDGSPLPSMHSDSYYPVPKASVRTGVLAMSMAVLNLVGKGK
jgi:hippurate hydrolase